MGRQLLRVRGLTKRFGGLYALSNVDLDVEEKKLVLLIGPNGSGKTTLINIISGFLRADKGSVFFNDIEITGMPPHKIFRLGLVRTFQTPRPFSHLTVLENLLVAYPHNPGEDYLRAPRPKSWKDYEYKAFEKAWKILKLVRLDHLWDQPSHTLSGGQLKLLELGRALMTDAKMIVMDEPAAGVNPTLAHELLSFLANLKESQGLTFLIVEHRLEIAVEYADYAYAMARGSIISHGKPLEVLKDPAVVESYLEG